MMKLHILCRSGDIEVSVSRKGLFVDLKDATDKERKTILKIFGKAGPIHAVTPKGAPLKEALAKVRDERVLFVETKDPNSIIANYLAKVGKTKITYKGKEKIVVSPKPKPGC